MTAPTMRPHVLLSLSLRDETQSEIHDRLSIRGHLASPEAVRRALDSLTADGLAHVEMCGRRRYYRLASGQAVEDALEAARGPA